MALNGDKQIRRELLAERAPAAAAPAGRRITSVYLTHLMCLIEALTVGFTDQHFGPRSEPTVAAAAATKVVDGS